MGILKKTGTYETSTSQIVDKSKLHWTHNLLAMLMKVSFFGMILTIIASIWFFEPWVFKLSLTCFMVFVITVLYIRFTLFKADRVGGELVYGDEYLYKPTENKPYFMKDRADSYQKKLEVLNALDEAWNRYPSLRLGQLIENVKPNGKDLFYIEDMQLKKLLEEYGNDKS